MFGTASKLRASVLVAVNCAESSATGHVPGSLDAVTTVTPTASVVAAGVIGVISAVYFLTPPWMRRRRYNLERLIVSAEDPIIINNTKFVTVRGKRYRVVYVPHDLSNQVPLIFFVHGLGSQIGVWENQIKKFSFNANILAVDLVGHGLTEFSRNREDYTTKSLVDDLAAILDLFPSQSVIMVAHSYGCALATFLYPQCCPRIQALVFIAPTGHVGREAVARLPKLLMVPECLLELGRWMDRWGGPYSASVNRSLGKKADRALRERQLRWNAASQTSAVVNTFVGVTIPGPVDLAKIGCPLLLIAGEEDSITPPGKNLPVIHEAVSPPKGKPNPDPLIIPQVGHTPMWEEANLCNAIIAEFLSERFASLDPEWQILQTKENDPNEKWSLKNYEKWMKTSPISEIPVGPSPLRAMKVMRQTDPVHSPAAFVDAHPEIGTVIDLSKDEPPYQTFELSQRGVEYVKVAGKSKIPPSKADVKQFNETVHVAISRHPGKQVAVHCHYGYNRTGFMICCYLIEVCGVPIPDAIDYFAKARPNGIRHTHFKDELYLRYSPKVRLKGSVRETDHE